MEFGEIRDNAELKMMEAVEAFERKLRSVRTGRASSALVENIQVQCYGSHSVLKQVATISTPEPRLIVLKPFDPNIAGDITRAISSSELGLNPQSDGRIIRIPIPPLTEERRKQFVKIVESEAEEARVAVRNVRREANREIERAKKAGEAPEDDCFRLKDEIQKMTDDTIEEINDKTEKKTTEIQEI